MYFKAACKKALMKNIYIILFISNLHLVLGNSVVLFTLAIKAVNQTDNLNFAKRELKTPKDLRRKLIKYNTNHSNLIEMR